MKRTEKTLRVITKNGFTVVELLVVIGIIVLIGGIILTSPNKLTTSARVDSAAIQIMDTLKKVRHDSVSIREFRTSLFPSYGLYIDMATPQKLTIYADCVIDDNGDKYIDDRDTFTYDPASTDCGGDNGFSEEITLHPHVKIRSITSYYFGTSQSETKIHLEYIRPEPTIWLSDSNDILIPSGRIEIEVTDVLKEEYIKKITIWSTGQFSIQ